MECNYCNYYNAFIEKDPKGDGECRFNPPGKEGFPKVYESMWCGKFRTTVIGNDRVGFTTRG